MRNAKQSLKGAISLLEEALRECDNENPGEVIDTCGDVVLVLDRVVERLEEILVNA